MFSYSLQKRVFLPDKKGLQWNMLAAHFCFSAVFSLQHNVQISNFSCQKDFIPVLFVGDSMIRFLTGVFNNVHVVSVSGAKLLSIFHCLVKYFKMIHTFVVILHVGTNDVNQCNKPSQIQLIKGKAGLFLCFRKHCKVTTDTQIFFCVFRMYKNMQ